MKRKILMSLVVIVVLLGLSIIALYKIAPYKKAAHKQDLQLSLARQTEKEYQFPNLTLEESRHLAIDESPSLQGWSVIANGQHGPITFSADGRFTVARHSFDQDTIFIDSRIDGVTINKSAGHGRQLWITKNDQRSLFRYVGNQWYQWQDRSEIPPMAKVDRNEYRREAERIDQRGVNVWVFTNEGLTILFKRDKKQNRVQITINNGDRKNILQLSPREAREFSNGIGVVMSEANSFLKPGDPEALPGEG